MAIMPRTQVHPRVADAKGRITLGERFANRTVLIEDTGDEVVVRPARVVAERELWLYRNKKAFRAVQDGIEAARAGESAPAPDMGKARRIADGV
jgi:hypothetical protein